MCSHHHDHCLVTVESFGSCNANSVQTSERQVELLAFKRIRTNFMLSALQAVNIPSYRVAQSVFAMKGQSEISNSCLME